MHKNKISIIKSLFMGFFILSSIIKADTTIFDINGKSITQHQDTISTIIGYDIETNKTISAGLMHTIKKYDEKDVILNISLKLQKSVNNILDKHKLKTKSNQIIVCIMDSKSGKVLTLASSNRYIPADITKQNHSNLPIYTPEYLFEAGSVMKPITMAILFENNLIKLDEEVPSYNGTINYGKYKIHDIHFDKNIKSLSIPYTIVHSSNVGSGLFAQRLSGLQFVKGLKSFGLAQDNKIETIPSVEMFDKSVYSPTTKSNVSSHKIAVSLGYEIRSTFMQLMSAYNVFNNNGIITKPLLINKIIKDGNQILSVKSESKRIISERNSKIIKKLLIKTVQEGTGKKTKIKGLEVGGKTATAHIFDGSTKYAPKQYISSFFGFVNDKNHHYTIGVTVFKSKRKWPYYFASETAVPIFKEVVDEMLKDRYLSLYN